MDDNLDINAEHLAENYLNGNISYCRKVLSELPPLHAACVAVQVFNLVCRDHDWLKFLERSAS